jgi:hypothetical protein
MYVLDGRLTDSNLAIAVLSLVVSLVRAITRRYDYLPRLAGILYDVILLLLWTYSIVAQVSGDLSDPEHPSPRPWYMTRGCQAGWETNRGICRATQASFAFSVMAVAVYCSRLVIQAAELIQERVGRRHYRGWQSLESGDGGGYNDDDHEIYKEKEDTAQRAIEDALSPVLAFFPER